MKKYFIVTAKCGHVGRSNYVPIRFAVKAVDGKEAARKARSIPRVKHDHKDAILNVKRVNFEKYINQAIANAKDSYLNAKNKQEQNRKCQDLDDRLVQENKDQEKDYEIERKRRVTYLMKKRQIDEKFNLSY